MYDPEPDVDHNKPPDAHDVALDETADNEPEYGSEDADLVLALSGRLNNELGLAYGNLANVPDEITNFRRLLYCLWHNLYEAPYHTAHHDRVDADAATIFQGYHWRLMYDFFEDYTVAHAMTPPGSALHTWGDEKYVLLEIRDRYRAIHAERVFAARAAFEETQITG